MLDGMTAAAANRTKPLILLDCDPGHDDAIAIVTAARFADLVGITTVAGNAPLERTTYNALVMRDLLGIDVPVHSGSDRPLVAEPKFAAVRPRRERSRRRRPPGAHHAARRDRRRQVHRRHLPFHRGDLARAGGPADQHRARHPLRSRHPRSHRRHLTDGRRNVRQPQLGRRVQHLGRPGSGGDRVRLGRPARHGRPRRHAPVPGDTGTRSTQVRALPGTLAAVLADLFVFFADTYLGRHDPGSIDGRRRPRSARRARRHPPDLVRTGRPPRGDRDGWRAHTWHDGDRSNGTWSSASTRTATCSRASMPTPRSTRSSTRSPTSRADRARSERRRARRLLSVGCVQP